MPEKATVDDAARQVAQRHPKLAPFLGSVRWAVNYEFVGADAALSEGDEVAVIPPVAGGTPGARLTRDPIDVDSARAEVAGPDIGAAVVFVGTVRDHAQGKAVERLEYEAYEPMAQKELERIARACGEGRGGCRVFIVHRHGELAVGEVSVVIAAASPHRAEAFDACRDALERIKVDVPIWKKEVSPDGESWVGWGGG